MMQNKLPMSLNDVSIICLYIFSLDLEDLQHSENIGLAQESVS